MTARTKNRKGTNYFELGSKFGRLTVVGIMPNGIHGNKRFKVVCDCGKQKSVNKTALSSGATLSCGCLAKERREKRMRSHGLSKTAEYRVWADMKNRCYNKNIKNYANYGGRGVSVCSEWADSFEKFISDMGARPSAEHTLDRIDNNGNYCKENCRWATKVLQSRNQRVRVDNSCGYRGVSFYKPYKKWRARIYISGKEKNIGYFDSIESAALARKDYEERFWNDGSH